jgi:hypothetical protein
LAPEIVTASPTAPDVDDKLLMLGVGNTAKLTALLAMPDTVTRTAPVVAEPGTGTVMDVELQLVGEPASPLNAIELVPWDEPKFVPVTVTKELVGPDVGDRPVMVGATTTVKLLPLLFTPLANTMTLPVVAPDGTVVAMLVALQLVTVADVPLNLTVPLP